MNPIYKKIRQRARQISAGFPTPEFYRIFSTANDQSRHFFESDPVIILLRQFVLETTRNNLGHGLDHAMKVSIDAGALIIIEGAAVGYSPDFMTRRLFLTQCAGLLHDLKRKHHNHAEKGAVFAREVLKAYPQLHSNDVEDISNAIHNHEAFRDQKRITTPEGKLISNCLYDADKFRWGPDNFTHTVWDMVSSADVPLVKFIEYYPKGIQALLRIRNTFRTATGKKYGPEFIDTGLAIGNKLNWIIKTEFANYIEPKRMAFYNRMNL